MNTTRKADTGPSAVLAYAIAAAAVVVSNTADAILVSTFVDA